MLSGLYSAAAGMAAQQQRIDGVANDLANASTTGYKHVRVGFRDLLYNAQGGSAGPTVLAGAGAAAGFIGRSQEQGALQTTDQPLDVAIQGPGFFQVKRPDGSLALTRDGSLRLDSQGRLTTSDGNVLQPEITVPRGTSADKLSIAGDGTVRAGAGRPLGRIELVTVPAPDGLQPLGGNLFAANAASGTPTAAGNDSTLRQGTLEGSNVDVGDAMVDMIDAQRSFQLASKAIQMQDQMLEIANQVKR
ncbi:MAG TPA: flagellar hook-basal body protein [Conexibacter sp.]|jgi:flagellar basal-body rod protein FlgG|nr:flagellar hook-basal body protein [Conexibacter sp.]